MADFKQFLLILIIALFFNQYATAQQVTLMKVTNKMGQNNPNLPEWQKARVSLTGKQDTYISIVSAPEKDKGQKSCFYRRRSTE